MEGFEVTPVTPRVFFIPARVPSAIMSRLRLSSQRLCLTVLISFKMSIIFSFNAPED